MFFAMDITVDGTNISLSPAHLIADYGNNTNMAGGSACCGIDVSADGRDLYMSAMPELRVQGYVHSIVRARMPSSLQEMSPAELPARVTVFEHPPTPTDYDLTTGYISVNGANDLLYVTQRVGPSYPRLLRADLDPDLSDTAGNPEVSILVEQIDGANEPMAADTQSSGSDSLVFRSYSQALNCYFLVIMNGRTGTILNQGTEWISNGGRLSWFGGRVLSEGVVASTKRSLGCRSTGWIVATDPLTGVSVPLITGRVPEGR